MVERDVVRARSPDEALAEINEDLAAYVRGGPNRKAENLRLAAASGLAVDAIRARWETAEAGRAALDARRAAAVKRAGLSDAEGAPLFCPETQPEVVPKAAVFYPSLLKPKAEPSEGQALLDKVGLGAKPPDEPKAKASAGFEMLNRIVSEASKSKEQGPEVEEPPKAKAEPKVEPKVEPAEGGLLVLPGTCGDIQQYYVETALYPSGAFSVLPGIMVPATLVAGRITGPSGPKGCAVQQYLVGLGRTTAGKQHVFDVMGECLTVVHAKELLGPSRFKSSGGLVRLVKDKPVILCRMDEFGSFLLKLGDERAMWCEKEIADRMKELWSMGPGSIYNTPVGASLTDDSIALEGVALLVVGMGVKDEFFAACQDIQVRNGFLNRISLVEEKALPKLNPNPSQGSFPPGLFHDLMKLKNLPKARLDWSAGAKDLWVSETERIRALPDDEQMLWARGPEKIVRLATVFACARGSALVGVSDMELAREIVRMGERPFREGIDEAEAKRVLDHAELKVEIERRLRTKFPGEGASRSEIERTFKNNKKYKDAVRHALEDMLGAETLEEVHVETGGRGKWVLRLKG